MPEVRFMLPSGQEKLAEVAEGTTIMHAALSNLVPGIIGECGGEMSCATCHVYVDEAWADRFPARDEGEEDMLQVTAAEPTELSRLSCQLRCTVQTNGAVVHVPELQ